jgi:hypothetical protein
VEHAFSAGLHPPPERVRSHSTLRQVPAAAGGRDADDRVSSRVEVPGGVSRATAKEPKGVKQQRDLDLGDGWPVPHRRAAQRPDRDRDGPRARDEGRDPCLARSPPGNASPTATIAGSNTGLNGPTDIALGAAGQLYVANAFGNSITATASVCTYRARRGTRPPRAQSQGRSTGLNLLQGIALDAPGRLHVANQLDNTITVYAPGARGDATQHPRSAAATPH